jgi:hypothetical protein
VALRNERLGQPFSGDTADQALEAADIYFSADVETDGPIPGPYSILSFALVYAGRFDGTRFERPLDFRSAFYRELKPISENFESEALRVNGLAPQTAMTDASLWVKQVAKSERAVLVAYPLSFDWSWLYWYFTRFSSLGSPFGYSRCFDIKTAVAVKKRIPINSAGRNQLPDDLRSDRHHSHNALDDAIEQAEIFAKIFELGAVYGRSP